MIEKNHTISPESELSSETSEVIDRFIAAFRERDAAAFVDLVAENCVMETIQPAPNGTRYEGYETNLHFWQTMVTDPNGSFEVEEVFIAGDRAVNRWRYYFGEGEENSVRGVTLLRVRDGKIVEALAYAKTQPVSDLGQNQETDHEKGNGAIQGQSRSRGRKRELHHQSI